MITITQGPPAEHQVWIMAGVVTYLIVAPLVIGAACMLGHLAGRRLSEQQKLANADTGGNELEPTVQWKLVPSPPILVEAHMETAA
jgi:hypothetical protein